VITSFEDAIIWEIEFTKLAKYMEILSVEKDASIENAFQWRFMGNGDFIEFVLKFGKVIICWDEFEGDSWFANYSDSSKKQ
jgi:hypothetical protein